jgi:hypothetical protein
MQNMKTRKIILLTLICSLAAMMSCSQYDYWEIPKDAQGKAVITKVATVTSTGISVLENEFTINATLPNARPGDVMTAELLKHQVPSWGGDAQLLPLAGTAKQVTVDNDLKVSVTFTRTEAQMANAGDPVMVTLAGQTESGRIQVVMAEAMTITNNSALFAGKSITLVKSDEAAYFEVKVTPRNTTYTGNVVAERKVGNGAWENVGTFSSPYIIPVTGNEFGENDAMSFRFTATSGSLSTTRTVNVGAGEPNFKLAKLHIMAVGKGCNIMDNAKSVNADALDAVIALDGGLNIAGGSAWTGAGNSIAFVPSTLAMYAANNFEAAIAAYNAGAPAASASAVAGEGVYIFKLVKGADEIYGMLKITGVAPGQSVTFNYLIGNRYSHLSVLK